MIRSLGHRSGAAAALLAALAVAIPASAAGAAETEPTITIDSPPANPPRDSETVTVSGRATSTSLGYAMKEVSLALDGKSTNVACGSTDCPFSWSVRLPLNGPYQLKVTATETAILLGDRSGEQLRGFSVAAPPARPTLDQPKVTEARAVELSWTRNTEPDMLYYAVFRKDPGATRFLQVGGKVDHPSTGSRVTFTDATATNEGSYAYQVVAVRKGASGTAATEAKSDPSGPVTAAVAASTATTAAPPGSPTGPTTTGRPARAGSDLSGFLSGSQPVTPTPTLPEPPDTGYGNLPFPARPAGEELEEGEPDAVPPRDRSTSVFSRGSTGRPLVPIAGGLVLLLLASHMRVLNRRIKPAADSDLPLDVDVPVHERVPAVVPVPSAATAHESRRERAPLRAKRVPVVGLEPEPPPEPEPEPVPVPVPVPVQQFYDIAQEADWAPPAATREPEPEPHHEPEPEWEPPVVDETEHFRIDDVDGDPDVDVDEIEVFEVVSPTRRRLERAGSR